MPGLWTGLRAARKIRSIDSGPGYRIDFARDRDKLVLLLAGTTKRRQAKAIATAHDPWRDYERCERIRRCVLFASWPRSDRRRPVGSSGA